MLSAHFINFMSAPDVENEWRLIIKCSISYYKCSEVYMANNSTTGNNALLTNIYRKEKIYTANWIFMHR